ncbi:18745_t:CDS:2 [Gigaspora margarita]|uniref:18745_t:CDS:1 n=1 Tax=Gigaspora margarita TaxID=4874 RepID=A0ABN7UWB6_GIGMA|nr:18745_t:CDS:2 [Gigaspora margarita]
MGAILQDSNMIVMEYAYIYPSIVTMAPAHPPKEESQCTLGV